MPDCDYTGPPSICESVEYCRADLPIRWVEDNFDAIPNDAPLIILRLKSGLYDIAEKKDNGLWEGYEKDYFKEDPQAFRNCTHWAVVNEVEE